PLDYGRSGGSSRNRYRHELWDFSGHGDGQVQRHHSDRHKLERDQYCGHGSNWSDNGQRRSVRKRGEQQRGKFYGRRSAEYHEPLNYDRSGGSSSNHYRHELWDFSGHRDGEVQRHDSDRHKLERDQYCGHGSNWSDNGQRRSVRKRSQQQRGEFYGRTATKHFRYFSYVGRCRQYGNDHGPKLRRL